MSIVNRRNAIMGWAVWTVGKQVMKQKAKSAMAPEPEGGRRSRAAARARRGRRGRRDDAVLLASTRERRRRRRARGVGSRG